MVTPLPGAVVTSWFGVEVTSCTGVEADGFGHKYEYEEGTV